MGGALSSCLYRPPTREEALTRLQQWQVDLRDLIAVLERDIWSKQRALVELRHDATSVMRVERIRLRLTELELMRKRFLRYDTLRHNINLQVAQLSDLPILHGTLDAMQNGAAVHRGLDAERVTAVLESIHTDILEKLDLSATDRDKSEVEAELAALDDDGLDAKLAALEALPKPPASEEMVADRPEAEAL